MKKLLSLLSVTAVFTVALLSQATAFAFDKDMLIDDAIFNNKNTMTAGQIDAFLNSFPNSCISTNNGFSSPEPIGYNPVDKFIYGANVSAGRVIYAASQAYDLNPQVLLATLQKEQSLVNGNAGCHPDIPSPGTFQCNLYGSGNMECVKACQHGGGCTYIAAGYDCPGNCAKRSVGFSPQVIKAAWMLKFSQQRSLGNINWAIVKGNWDNSDDPQSCYSGPMTEGNHQVCPSGSTIAYDGYFSIDGNTKNVYMGSGATAALYRYTPFTHGNQLFVNIFENWFGSTSQSILFKVAGSGTYYLEWHEQYYPIPSSEILKAYGLASIAPRTVSDFPSGKTKGPLLERAAKFGSSPQVYVIDGGKRHATNASTLARHGFSGWGTYEASLYNMLGAGDDLAPVVRMPNGAIYLIENNKKRAFPDWETYSNLSGPNAQGNAQIYSKQVLTNMTKSYINNKADGAPMLLDGKFLAVKDNPAIYLYDNGKKQVFNTTTFAMWGAKTDYRFSTGEINQIPTGDEAPLLISSGGKEYVVNKGRRKEFDAATLAAWGLNENAFTSVTDRAFTRLGSDSKVTRLVEAVHHPGVFYVKSGVSHGIPSLQDFSRLGFSWSDVSTLSRQAVKLLPRGADLYAPGSLIRLPNGAVYVIDDGFVAHGVTSGESFARFGFSWSKVTNVSSGALAGYTADSLLHLLKNKDSDAFYVVQDGKKHLVSTAAFSSGQFDFTDDAFTTAHPNVLRGITTGKPLTRFLRAHGKPTVYFMENGKRRPFSTEAAFFAKGGTWSQVVEVSEKFLQEFPRGSKL